MQQAMSIGIAFKNPGTYFELALKSVFAQTFDNWELILVDDGSSDDSLALALALKDTRVRVYSDGINRGLSARLNQIAELAQAPYCARMDADDVMHPERIEKQYKVLCNSNGNSVAGTAAYSIDRRSQVVGAKPVPTKPLSGFGVRHSFVHPSIAAPTAWFRRNPYSTQSCYLRGEDAELWCRTKSNSEFVYLPERLLFYREDSGLRFSNYTGTGIALLNIINTYFCKRTLPYLFLTARELGKIFSYAMCMKLGLANILISRRYLKIPDHEIQEGKRILDHIAAQGLPL
jgi:glycosyltransferase involved in cell wall biosynthesis